MTYIHTYKYTHVYLCLPVREFNQQCFIINAIKIAFSLNGNFSFLERDVSNLK